MVKVQSLPSWSSWCHVHTNSLTLVWRPLKSCWTMTKTMWVKNYSNLLNSITDACNTLLTNSVFIQALMFSHDGTVKQNMQSISLPYHSGVWNNKQLWFQRFFSQLVTSENNLLHFAFLFIRRRHQHFRGFILPYLTPEQFWVANSDPTCPHHASLHQPGTKLQIKDKRYDLHFS